MKKIYLAVSEREKEEVNKVITKNFPGMEFIYLQTKSEIKSALNSTFFIFVTTSDHVDIRELKTINLKGKCYFLDSTGQLKVNIPNVFTCKSVDDLIVEFRLSLFSGLQFDKQGTLPINKSQNESTQQDIRIENKERTVDQPIQEKNVHKEPTKQDSVVEKPSKEAQSVDETNNNEDHATQDSNIEVEEETEKGAISTEEVLPKKSKTQSKHHNQNTSETEVKNPSLTEKALKIGEAMDLVTFKNKKTVGLWAPLSAGVTTFLIDFAIYLQQYDAPVAVVEVPKQNQHHLKILERFGPKPENWVSLIENLNTTTEPNNRSLWMYRGIKWFPLGLKDTTFMRDTEFTNNYFLAVKRTKFVMVDLPTGEMVPSTLDSLPHLDELWIFIDDNFDRQLDWKNFIYNTLIGNYNLSIKLIHSRTIPSISHPKEAASKFDLPLIAVLPAMWELVVANRYKRKPLIDNLSAFKKLEPSFHQLAKELIGDELEEKYQPSFWLKLKRKLLGSIDSN